MVRFFFYKVWPSPTCLYVCSQSTLTKLTLASKLICMYFQSNSTPLAPTHKGRRRVITSSAVAQPKKDHNNNNNKCIYQRKKDLNHVVWLWIHTTILQAHACNLQHQCYMDVHVIIPRHSSMNNFNNSFPDPAGKQNQGNVVLPLAVSAGNMSLQCLNYCFVL